MRLIRTLATRSSLAMALAGLLSAGAFAQPKALKIGVVLDQSTINADIGRDYLAGARTFFDHSNAQGGIRGTKINLLVRDDEGDPVRTVALARELIQKEGVDVLFGFVGDQGVAKVYGDRVFRAAGIALFAPLSGAELSKSPDNVFYIRPTYRDEARFAIRHFGMLGNSRFTVVSSTNQFGDNLAKDIVSELAASKLAPIGRHRLEQSFQGLDALIASIVKQGPQVVMLATDTIATAEFVKRFRQRDRGINLVSFSTVNHRTLMELAKPEFAAGMMLTQVVPHPELALSKVQTEHLALMAKYRDEPPSHITLEGFLAAKALVLSIGRANSLNRGGILAALSAERRLDVGGITFAFSASGDRGSKFVDLAFLRRSGRLVQ